MTLLKIAEACGGTYVGTKDMEHTEVTSVVLDSRKAEPGALFIATRGERVADPRARYAPAGGAGPAGLAGRAGRGSHQPEFGLDANAPGGGPGLSHGHGRQHEVSDAGGQQGRSRLGAHPGG